MIELYHVSKHYKVNGVVHDVLHDITFTLPAKENIGIMGLNGAGKSTLLRLLGGVEQPSSGYIVRKGRISWPIGFSGGFNNNLSGEENCRFVARIYHENVDRVVGFAQEFAQIGKHFYLPVRTYSSGMRARLAFGLSMAIDFDVYLVDEVTEVGDQVFRRRCREVFRARQERSSLVMVSHNIKTIRQYCTKCAILTKGSLHLFDSVDEAEAVYNAL